MIKRLDILSSYISKTDRVADIGCDHAYLSKILAKRKIYSIACDINPFTIKTYKDKYPKELLKHTDFRVSDGLSNILNEDNINVVVLSGLGTHTILNILKNTIYENIITISNNKHYLLRKEMNNRNFYIFKEEIIKENDIYYNLIYFKKGDIKHKESDYILGINHQNIPLYKEYLENQININNDILKQKYVLKVDKTNKILLKELSKL